MCLPWIHVRRSFYELFPNPVLHMYVVIYTTLVENKETTAEAYIPYLVHTYMIQGFPSDME